MTMYLEDPEINDDQLGQGRVVILENRFYDNSNK